jgi:hypothetical protein
MNDRIESDEIERLRVELEATRRAKQENDERFQLRIAELAEELTKKSEAARRNFADYRTAEARRAVAEEHLAALAEQLEAGQASDGYHTHSELYEYRMLYNAHAAAGWAAAGIPVVKSWHHDDGQPCFGGGWFVVVAELPPGQVSNHYAAEHWPLFDIPEVERPPAFDGHTPTDAAARLRAALEPREDTDG